MLSTIDINLPNLNSLGHGLSLEEVEEHGTLLLVYKMTADFLDKLALGVRDKREIMTNNCFTTC